MRSFANFVLIELALIKKQRLIKSVRGVIKTRLESNKMSDKSINIVNAKNLVIGQVVITPLNIINYKFFTISDPNISSYSSDISDHIYHVVRPVMSKILTI